MLAVARCCLLDSSERPSTKEVRAARRLLLQSVKGDGPVAECSKGMLSYDGPKGLMQLAAEHTARGMDDDAATTAFEVAYKKFEAHFDAAFGDLYAWSFGALGGGPFLKWWGSQLDEVAAFQVALFSAVVRWSPTTLQSMLEDVGSGMSSIMAFVQASDL